MKVVLSSVSARRAGGKNAPLDAVTADYLARAARYLPTSAELFATETSLLTAVSRQPGRGTPYLILFDSRGDALTSDEFARRLERLRDSATPRLMLAIGPHSGWSAAALARADGTVSLGRMTLPHELARAVAAEQIYRALTILAGHPYHSGH